ncbi:MAG: hypothetical protein KDC49_18295 [Saprospiraceae bacterium]|nr:hypothetical protein [Saprospiraceae bacterium]
MRLIKDSILNLAFLLTIMHGLLVHTHSADQSLYQVNAFEHQHVDLACFAKHIVDRDLGGDHLENFTSTDLSEFNILPQSSYFGSVPSVFLNFDLPFDQSGEQYQLEIITGLIAQGCLFQFGFRGPPTLS